MSRKWLKTTLIFLTAAAMGAALAACASSSEAPYDFTVTFDYNEPYSLTKVTYACNVCDYEYDETVGYLQGSIPAGTAWENVPDSFACPACRISQKADFTKKKNGRTPEYFGIKAEDPYIYIRPGEGQPATGLEKFTEYYVKSWHLPETDEAGNPIVLEDGTVSLGREWNFKEDRVEDSMTLYANLTMKPRIIVMDGENVAHTYYGEAGDVRGRPAEGNEPQVAGKTFYEYYADKDLTTKFEWPYTFVEGEDKVIYGKFLLGNWRIVTSAVAFNEAIAAGSISIWLDDNITFTSTTKYTPNRNFRAELNGNGHTISGIDVSLTGMMGASNVNFGVLFGDLGATAYIHNVNFENVHATFTTLVNTEGYLFTVSMFAKSAAEGARIEDVTVTGTIEATDLPTNPEYNFSKSIANDNTKPEDVSGFAFDQVVIPSAPSED